ncbi:MAG: glycoside hydrolase family 2 TIM barrel-domain containing protein [bacterium]
MPAWGPKTMKGDLERVQESQMQEMILAHYDHPSIYAWGLCNEIGGQRPAAHQFVQRGVEIARQLDNSRLLTWASNTLQTTPEKDASRLVDFVEWNDYWESWYGGELKDVEKNLQEIRRAFPDKSVVISEFGLCECDPKNPTGDDRRIEILQSHTNLYRRAPNVAGAIFFSYNDYRTHIGDKSKGSFRQRVHGVVDLLGRPKPSWQVLRKEASPIKRLAVGEPEVQQNVTRASVELVTRSLQDDMPAYTLRDYLLVWVAYNDLEQPIASGKVQLADLPPGSRHSIDVYWKSFQSLFRVRVEVFRPTGYSVHDSEWRCGHGP